MDCKEMILSEETYDIITDFSASEFLGDDNNCYERIGEDFLILYLGNLGIRNPKIDFFPYHNMPKLYGLMQLSPSGETPPGVAPFDPADLIASGHDFNKEPIGTGPYKFVAWNKGESIELEANEDYWGGAPAIKHVIWKIIPEGSSRTMALEAGEVDMIIEVESTDLSRLQDNPDIVTVNEPGTGHNWMMVNNEKAPFDNVDFRRAIDAAVDKNAVVQVALNGQGSVSDSMLPECFAGVVTDGAPTYDPEKAKEYLAASGLNPADCTFALICSDDTKLRAGQVIQSSLKENLGIDVTLESMDLATYLDKTAVGDYQAAIGGYTSSDVLAHSMGVYHSKAINGSNKTRLNDPEIDALIDKVKATLDPEENLKVVTELSKALNDTCTQVPIYLKNNVRAYAKGLEGFKMSPSGGMYISELSWSE